MKSRHLVLLAAWLVAPLAPQVVEVAQAAEASARLPVTATVVRPDAPDAPDVNAAATAGQGSAASPRLLRVCADPNNLPFSNAKREGFENRIADILGQELGAKVEYTWWAQRRGFIRNTLKAGKCDLVMGLPAHFDLALTTKPYYRSSYVFVTRRDRHLNIRSFDDPQLRKLEIGVQLIGDDYNNTPPAHALARRHIVDNVKGYLVYGDYRDAVPTAQILDALVKGDIDVAVVWGPLAGYYAQKSGVPLALRPVLPHVDQSWLPMEYAISLGVRHGDRKLRDEIDAAMARRQADIQKLLHDYGVPLVTPNQTAEVGS